MQNGGLTTYSCIDQFFLSEVSSSNKHLQIFYKTIKVFLFVLHLVKKKIKNDYVWKLLKTQDKPISMNDMSIKIFTKHF